METGTNRFTRHLPRQKPDTELPHLVADANFSRNVTFHVIRSPKGDDLWIGRYLTDLLEVVAECHPDGLLVEVEGFTYHLIVAPTQKDLLHG